MTRSDAIVKTITRSFDEMDVDEVSDLPVEPEYVDSVTATLLKLGFDVKADQRFADVERTKLARYVLTVRRGRYGQNTDNSDGTER